MFTLKLIQILNERLTFRNRKGSSGKILSRHRILDRGAADNAVTRIETKGIFPQISLIMKPAAINRVAHRGHHGPIRAGPRADPGFQPWGARPEHRSRFRIGAVDHDNRDPHLTRLREDHRPLIVGIQRIGRPDDDEFRIQHIDRGVPRNIKPVAVIEAIDLIPDRGAAKRSEIRAEIPKQRIPHTPGRDIAKFLFPGDGFFNFSASPIQRLIPGNTLEAGQIAALDRLQQRILQPVWRVKTLPF